MFQHPLAREVALIVAVKTLLVIAAGFLVFGPGHRPQVGDDGIADRLLSAPAASLYRRSIP